MTADPWQKSDAQQNQEAATFEGLPYFHSLCRHPDACEVLPRVELSDAALRLPDPLGHGVAAAVVHVAVQPVRHAKEVGGGLVLGGLRQYWARRQGEQEAQV